MRYLILAAAVLASALAMSQADLPSLAEPAPTPSLNGGSNLCRVLDRLETCSGSSGLEISLESSSGTGMSFAIPA